MGNGDVTLTLIGSCDYFGFETLDRKAILRKIIKRRHQKFSFFRWTPLSYGSCIAYVLPLPSPSTLWYWWKTQFHHPSNEFGVILEPAATSSSAFSRVLFLASSSTNHVILNIRALWVVFVFQSSAILVLPPSPPVLAYFVRSLFNPRLYGNLLNFSSLHNKQGLKINRLMSAVETLFTQNEN